MSEPKLKLLAGIATPRSDCGVCIVMYRQLVERPSELHVTSNADFADDLVVHAPLWLPHVIYRLRKRRFGPRLVR
jgi:hypothetical protein